MIITKELRKEKINKLLAQKELINNLLLDDLSEEDIEDEAAALAAIDYELYCWEELYSQLDGQNINIKEEEWMHSFY